MYSILNFLLENIQTILSILAFIFAFGTYFRDKNEKISNAANIICLEIESVSKAINNITFLTDPEEVFKTSPIYENLYWFEYRNLVVGKMGMDNVDLINKFYDKVIKCEKARELLQQIIIINRSSKIDSIQENISSILCKANNEYKKFIEYDDSIPNFQCEKLKKTKEVANEINSFHNLVNEFWFDFIPNGIIDRYKNAFTKYSDLEPIAYFKLKKIAGIRHN